MKHPRQPKRPSKASRPSSAHSRRDLRPGDDPGTLTDEEDWSAGGPDPIDEVTDDDQPEEPPPPKQR